GGRRVFDESSTPYQQIRAAEVISSLSLAELLVYANEHDPARLTAEIVFSQKGLQEAAGCQRRCDVGSVGTGGAVAELRSRDEAGPDLQGWVGVGGVPGNRSRCSRCRSLELCAPIPLTSGPTPRPCWAWCGLPCSGSPPSSSAIRRWSRSPRPTDSRPSPAAQC